MKTEPGSIIFCSVLDACLRRSTHGDREIKDTNNEVMLPRDPSCQPITCDFNDADVTLTCCLHDNEAYVPFDAVERYFEVCCSWFVT